MLSYQPPQPDYPFQQICCDYLSLNGIPYLVTVDKLTGWLNVKRAKNNEAESKGLIVVLRELFTPYGISEELTSDGRSEFTANEVQMFL